MFSTIPGIVPLFPCMCTVILLSCLPAPDPDPASSGLQVYFLDVGQGDACAIRTPRNRWYLDDVGNDAHALLAFLERAKIDTLQAILLSHPDLDHYGALSAVLKAVPVKQVFLPVGSSPNPAWRSTLADLDASQTALDTLFEGDTLFGDGARIKVVWPPPFAPFSGNDLSTVFRVEFAGKRILLTGDIETPAEQAIRAGHPDLAADILKVAHHGSRTSSGLAFVRSVAPIWSIISCDSSVYGHPHAEAWADLEWVMGDSARILRTDREGMIAFELGEWGVRRMDPWERGPGRD
jgi:competence protein ComEC